MKKISILKYLAIASVFLSANFGFAQVVQVPSNCRVVVAGTGGTLGFGPTGRVGQGGVVAMPDILLVSPFTTNQGGTFTFIPPIATPAITTATWSLLGDLSNTTASNTVNGVTGRFNGATNPPAGLTATILSYNRRYRTSEGVAPSDPSWARSNGQVRVNWASGGCGSSITFNVYKNFNQTITTLVAPITPVAAVPIIVGPDCLKPNTQYTYSVDQIVSDNTNDAIGFDSYYWSGLPIALVNASTTYTSADRSSITFTTGATVSTFTLRCCYGRVNPNTADGGISTLTDAVSGTHTTCVTKSLLIAPVAPNYNIGFAPPACVATGTVAAPATFSIRYPNVVGGQTYTWTATNTGWVDNGTGSATTFTPVVNSPSAGTTTLTVNTAGNNNPGVLTLTITGNGCDPAIFNYQINRNITTPLTIVTPGGTPPNACLSSTNTPTGNSYTISPTNSNGVEWYLTAVGSTTPITITGVSLANANTATVTINTTNAAVGSFWLNVRSSTASCNTTAINTTINIQPAAPAFTASSPTCVVRSTTGVTTVAVTPVAGATSYTWSTVPANASGVTITNGTTANPTIVFNSPTGVNSVTLSVTANGVNGCNSASTNRTINYITVATNFTGGAFNDQYSVSGTCGAVTSWTLSTGVTPNIVSTTYTASSGNITITGANNNFLQVSGTSGLPLTAVCTNLASGITVCANMTGATNTQRLAAPGIKGVTLSPNPNSGTFFITLESLKTEASATLYNLSGKEINSYPLKKGENKIENENLAAGTYIVKLVVDGKTESKQIIIN